MTARRPERAIGGLRHVALYVRKLEQCERFYVELLGMSVEWRPDADNVYLCSGTDNLALHRARPGFAPDGDQRLDHIGFIVRDMADVDVWHQFFVAQDVAIRAAPRTHRDGARSFYCEDPDGNVVQMIHHPPIAGR
ncbi:MAG: VOC family protein [Gammaproteobacteria bacterium]|nr:VOC family protein [Gammaproteobacteria bacterium]